MSTTAIRVEEEQFCNNYFGQGNKVKDLTIIFEGCKKRYDGGFSGVGDWYGLRFQLHGQWYYLNFNPRTKQSNLCPDQEKK